MTALFKRIKRATAELPFWPFGAFSLDLQPARELCNASSCCTLGDFSREESKLFNLHSSCPDFLCHRGSSTAQTLTRHRLPINCSVGMNPTHLTEQLSMYHDLACCTGASNSLISHLTFGRCSLATHPRCPPTRSLEATIPE